MNALFRSLLSSRRVHIILGSIGILLAIYALCGFILLPLLVKHKAPELINQALNRNARITDIRFNPFLLTLDIHEVDISSLDNQEFARFQHFHADINVVDSIKQRALTLDKILLDQPYVFIQRNAQGTFNFSDLLQPSTQPPPEKNGSPFPLIIKDVSIRNARLGWEDHFYSHPHKETIYPLNLSLSDFTTQINSQSSLGLDLQLGSGGKLNWQGNFSLQPLASNGSVSITGISFPRVWEMFLQDAVNFEILEGSESISARYTLNDGEQGIDLKINDAQIHLFDLKLGAKGDKQALIDVPEFKLSDISLDLQQRAITVAGLSSQNVQLITQLNKNGELNLQQLFSPAEPATAATQTPPPSPAKKDDSGEWNITLKQLALTNYDVQFTDLSLAEKPRLHIHDLQLNGTDLSNQRGTALPLQLALKFNQQASIQIHAETTLEPLTSQLKVKVDNLAINDFQAYLDQHLNLDIVSGAVSVDTQIALTSDEQGKPHMHIKGDAHIDKLVTRDTVAQRDLLNWHKLSLQHMDLNLGTQVFNIDSITLDKPYARVLIRKDKSVNMADVKKASTQPTSSVAEEKKPAEKSGTAVQFNIASIHLKNGVSDFSDQSLILPFAAHINKLNGSIKGISSNQNKQAKIKLDGRVADISPVKIRGKLNPYRGDSSIQLDFNSMPLPLATPYMAEFAGRKIEKGNMSLALAYQINNKKLQASNKLFIDQLVLGDEVENPKATSLPLELAIALLEDSEGKINLDVPITGSLEDPEFSIGGIIIDALVNVISKIVTAPFSAIASLIDSEEDISRIMFADGAISLNDQQQLKLAGLADALIKRPRLNLEIKGLAFSEADWPALQEEALHQQLLQLQADKLSKESGKKVIPENINLSEKDYKELLAERFIEKFPQLAERSLFGTPRLIDPKLGEFFSTAKQKMSAIIKPDPHRLHQLAQQRAQAIAKHMITKGIEVERMFVLDAALDPTDEEKTPAVQLNLVVN